MIWWFEKIPVFVFSHKLQLQLIFQLNCNFAFVRLCTFEEMFLWHKVWFAFSVAKRKWEPASSFLYVGTITYVILHVLLTLCGVMKILWMWLSVVKESEYEPTRCYFLLAVHISEIFSRWVKWEEVSWKQSWKWVLPMLSW